MNGPLPAELKFREKNVTGVVYGVQQCIFLDHWREVVSGISHNLCVILQLDILSKFEGRIHKLEDTIVPVHRETDDLQRRQASILNLEMWTWLLS